MKTTNTALPCCSHFEQSRALQLRSHAVIPGGCHTYAKGDDQYPTLSPGFVSWGKGSHVWDVDGNEYIEYGMGNRCVTLGHAFEPVLEAVRAALEKGSNFIRPASIEVECAEEFLSIIAGAEMVKFTKDGSAATTAAIKLSRAHTGRDKIAFCVDHPFFASDDWFIGTTAVNAGVPHTVRNMSLPFRYNDMDSVRALFAEHPGQIAAVILEPSKYDEPEDGFLHHLSELCHREGAVFILDEMITGFRYDNGGAQQLYGVVPDLSTFGKALANGFALSALCGKRDLMELGGLSHSRERVFLLSTTHGAETHAMAAAIATMRFYQAYPVVPTLYQQGTKLCNGLRDVINSHGLEEFMQILGRPCNLVFSTLDRNQRPSQGFRALLLQELIRRGVIGPSLVISYSHSDEDLEHTIAAFDDSLGVYADALEDGYEAFLVGPPTKSVYRRFN